jgi:DNA-nicking Smr family endonuclease
MAIDSGKPRNRQRRVEVSADDALLFREAIGCVRPLADVGASVPSSLPPSPVPEQFLRDEARVRGELLDLSFDPAAIELGDEICWLKAGQPASLLRRLRRGDFSVRAEIDLHEMSAAVARVATHAFLDDCLRNHEFCVRIVHGKGLRSRNTGPVLKRLTATLLARRKDVLAYASARPAQGGTGAVVVLLQRD